MSNLFSDLSDRVFTRKRFLQNNPRFCDLSKNSIPSLQGRITQNLPDGSKSLITLSINSSKQSTSLCLAFILASSFGFDA